MISANDLLITPIVQILGRILLHFVWQGLAVALVLWVLFFMFKTSQVRYVLACAALALMTLLPMFTGIRVAREQSSVEGNRYVLEASPQVRQKKNNMEAAIQIFSWPNRS
jgi:cadmium resistance protein CadD (predicted permease)